MGGEYLSRLISCPDIAGKIILRVKENDLSAELDEFGITEAAVAQNT